jgi:hypothetical protein
MPTHGRARRIIQHRRLSKLRVRSTHSIRLKQLRDSMLARRIFTLPRDGSKSSSKKLKRNVSNEFALSLVYREREKPWSA